MPLFVEDVVQRRSSVNVGILPTVIVPMIRLHNNGDVVIEIINDGAEPLNAKIYVSKTGDAPLEELMDDTFADMQPNTVRSWRGTSLHGYVEITGNFSSTPSTVRRTAILYRNTT